mgnify:CR=1 FL=1
MPECPNCHEYYFGTPEKCPKCQKILPSAKEPQHTRIKEPSTNNRNIGNTIQTFSYVTLAINIIATIICAIIFGKFLIILLLGIVVSAIIFLYNYAFGRLVESSIITAENSANMAESLNKIVQNLDSTHSVQH